MFYITTQRHVDTTEVTICTGSTNLDCWKTLPVPMSLNFCRDIQMEGSEFNVNSMKPSRSGLPCISGSGWWWWFIGVVNIWAPQYQLSII